MKTMNIVVALLVMLSLTISATALETKSMTRENGVSAYASWSNTVADGQEYTYLSVMKTDKGTDLYMDICIADMSGNYNCMYGFGFTQEDVFTMDKYMDSATLSSVNIDLFNSSTGMIEKTVQVQASWTGVGDVTKGSSHYISKFGDYTYKFSDSVSFRQATATGTLDGNELGTSVFGEMDKFKRASMSMEK
jgi:hypothetical protein